MHLHLEVARVQPHQGHPGRHLLVVAYEDLQHRPAHARAHRGDVGLDEGVVGRHVAVPVAPGPHAPDDGGEDHDAQHHEDDDAPAAVHVAGAGFGRRGATTHSSAGANSAITAAIGKASA